MSSLEFNLLVNLYRRVLECLIERGTPLTSDELSNLIGCTPAEIKQVLRHKDLNCKDLIYFCDAPLDFHDENSDAQLNIVCRLYRSGRAEKVLDALQAHENQALNNQFDRLANIKREEALRILRPTAPTTRTSGNNALVNRERTLRNRGLQMAYNRMSQRRCH
ncbi:hypothetical protein [Neptuniibacter sp. QD37_11]|uniref:hypothetical protein n=1 Tax=Neptuniibacter sp. QD37_11 TaxID=3398209 RepID=UPI0039F56E76